MFPDLSYGGYGSTSPLSYSNSLGAYSRPFTTAQLGYSPAAVVPAPVPAPSPVAPPVATPPVSPALAPASVSTAGAATPAITSFLPLNQDGLTDSLRAAGVAAVNPAQEFSLGGAIKGTFLNEDGSFNLGGINSLVQGIGALSNIWSGFQQNKLAREAFDLQKAAYETNLTNSIQAYNTALEDRANNRAAFTAGGGANEASDYIAKNRLER